MKNEKSQSQFIRRSIICITITLIKWQNYRDEGQITDLHTLGMMKFIVNNVAIKFEVHISLWNIPEMGFFIEP